ncbi:PTS sugar transporter subunit IIA [Mesomycoplasma lagogenitalium]|uniref:Ascorbate-specific PTS system EIIA component n=1 Tax=Mesomycoplasma lagogenitalium TaxID=171286 RepID=A0ABY8LUM5_9BACT|nr:PTS sugar transporter subunit IIA [Mesomycoplasma lagogenitalium]WGI36405.1 PTS sugar transporter subunit IIA [Mesomycoplasma lagogenitalium]
MKKINLLEILKENDTISLNLTAKDWKEAVYLSIRPLIDKKLVEPRYYDAVIESTLNYGPYYIISENLAMPHAQSDAGVLENCFSLVTLKDAVYFENDSRPVKILIALGATSADVHTSEALPQIVAVFEDQKTLNSIMNAKTKEEVLEIIEKTDFTKYLQ